MAEASRDDALRATLVAVAPGMPLRDGLERILRGNTGALVVLGWDKGVQALCTGGFELDVEFSATRLRELSKMDGAVVVTSDVTRIVRAGVQLVPDPTIPTEETGTRHRTAQRVATQTGFPVVSVSQSMRIIALYVAGVRYVLDDSAAILSRANQALATLERYTMRLDEVTRTLSALEIEDLVTVRDAMVVVQRLEMVRRIAAEIEGYVVELGTDGRLLSLQLEELLAGLDSERELVVRDYLGAAGSSRKARTLEDSLADLDALTPADLLDLAAVARALSLGTGPDALESPVSPRGYRILAKVPRLPQLVVDRIVDHFGGLQKLLHADIEELLAVEGVGDMRANTIKDGLGRLTESTLLDRYV